MPKSKPSSSQGTDDFDTDESRVNFFDKKSIEQLVKDLTPLLVPVITAAVERVFDQKLAAIAGRLESVKRDNVEMTARIVSLEGDIKDGLQRESLLQKRLSAVEQYSRRDNLIIVGLYIRSYAEAATANP
jgi:hypothetical protein